MFEQACKAHETPPRWRQTEGHSDLCGSYPNARSSQTPHDIIDRLSNPLLRALVLGAGREKPYPSDCPTPTHSVTASGYAPKSLLEHTCSPPDEGRPQRANVPSKAPERSFEGLLDLGPDDEGVIFYDCLVNFTDLHDNLHMIRPVSKASRINSFPVMSSRRNSGRLSTGCASASVFMVNHREIGAIQDSCAASDSLLARPSQIQYDHERFTKSTRPRGLCSSICTSPSSSKSLEVTRSKIPTHSTKDSDLDSLVFELKVPTPRSGLVRSSPVYTSLTSVNLKSTSILCLQPKPDVSVTNSFGGDVRRSRGYSVPKDIRAEIGQRPPNTRERAARIPSGYETYEKQLVIGSAVKKEPKDILISPCVENAYPHATLFASTIINQAAIKIDAENTSRNFGYNQSAIKADETDNMLDWRPNNDELRTITRTSGLRFELGTSIPSSSYGKRCKVGWVDSVSRSGLPLQCPLSLALSLLILGNMITNNRSKIKTCSGIQDGSSSYFHFPPNPGLPSGSGQLGRHIELANDGIQSSPGPGSQYTGLREHLRVPSLDYIAAWAAMQGYGLVPLQYTSLGSFPQLSFLPTPPPVPLPSRRPNIPPSTTTLPDLEAFTGFDSHSSTLNMPQQPIPIVRSTYSDIPNTLHDRSSSSSNQFFEVEHNAGLPSEQLASFNHPDKDLDSTNEMNRSDTHQLPTINAEDWGSFYEFLSSAPEGTNVYPSLDTSNLGATTSSDEYANQTAVVSLGPIDHPRTSRSTEDTVAHTSSQRAQLNDQPSPSGVISGPVRSARTRRFRCREEGCGQHFPRRHRLEEHMSFTHRGERAYPCTFFGCNKRYSNPSNMKRHLKKTHGGHVPRSSEQTGGCFVAASSNP